MSNNQLSSSLFFYYPPKNGFKGILSIPHSGEHLPEEFKSFLVNNYDNLAQDVDWRVHELVDIEYLQSQGIAIIYSNIIRTAVDLNRSPDKAVLNWKKNSKAVQIVTSTPSEEDSSFFLGKYYFPYYEMLKTMYLELKTKTEKPSFIDLHSMPTIAEDYHLAINPNQERERPNFCLSDRHGQTDRHHQSDLAPVQVLQTRELRAMYPLSRRHWLDDACHGPPGAW